MSTLSSLVIASSSTLTIDLIKDNVVKDMSDKKQVLCIRVLIVIFIAISAIIAVIQYKSAVTFIAQLMGISWGALAVLSLHHSSTPFTGKRQQKLPAGHLLCLDV